ncbi:hypoxia inducible factor 1 subunit alpha, like 2 isoform X2 [Clupea harengus]|uniref:Hypoxia-inducible factor 1-alpha n=1 Tax=Clupea harengus TaxID=7950 RepID=A0A6P8FNP8_CLUHA|nr:hypoxia inducible factor 1 subunit alpha, like 2 isoform X2 [Clupea harengus]
MIEDHIEAALSDHLNTEHDKEKGDTEKDNGLKKQRQSTALKRARFRIAARGRRQRERQLFKELADLLPLPPNIGAQLKKASIIRLTAGYLHVRALADQTSNFQQTQNTEDIIDVARPFSLRSIHPHFMTAIPTICLEERLLDLALGGFLLVTFLDGQVIFTTENVNKYIGINQIYLIGRSLFDIMHPFDQKEVKQVLAKLAGNEGRQNCSIFWRTMNTINLRPVPWKMLHCTGVKKPFLPLASHCLLLLCRPLPVQGIEDIPASLNHTSFLSIHSPDMRFTYCDSRVWELTGFLDTELFGHSVYKYYHTSDCLKLFQAHICLLSKGQVTTGKYRLLLKHGGYVWAQTEATVVYNNQTRQPQNIFCINYVLSDAELSDLVFSLEQLQHSLKPHRLCVETTLSPLLADIAGQKTGSQANESALLANTTGHTWLTDSSAVFNRNICEKTSVSCEKWDGDLGALASMDGEDSLLFPMLDYPRERQESSKDCGLSGNVLNVHHYQDEGMPHASECVLCSSNPVAIFHGCQEQPQCNSSWTQRHRICKTGNSLTQRDSGNPWLVWSTLRTIVKQEFDAPQEYPTQNPQCYQKAKMTPIQSSQHDHPPNSRRPTSYPYPTWQRNRDGETCIGNHHSQTSAHWRSGHINNLRRPGKPKDSSRGRVASFPLTLPVLSHRECEVNAPLGPASFLLNGTEITSVLDQASTRISVG